MTDTTPPRILVADDEPAVLLSHSIILERQGYGVLTAGTFESALELVRNEDFDLLVCDLSLDHGTSGLDIINVALERKPRLPVILLTGYADTELPAHYSAQQVRLVTKPAPIPQFLQILESLLRRKDSDSHTCAAD